MNSLDTIFIFKKVTKDTTDDNLLTIASELLHEFYKEINEPYQILPSFIIKDEIINPYRREYEIVYILMEVDRVYIGISYMSIAVTHVNKEMTSLGLYITPEYRKNNFGKDLLKESLSHIPEHVQKVSMNIRVDHGYTYFKEMINITNLIESKSEEFDIKMTGNSRRSLSSINEFDLEKVAKNSSELRKTAENKGFNILLIENAKFNDNLSFTKMEYINMLTILINDMPKEDSSWDDIDMNEEDFDNQYKRSILEKSISWAFVATDKTGKPVAMTETKIFPHYTPLYSYQWDTGVLASYRGNKLGLTLKYLMLNKLLTDSRSKNVKYWSTYNASSNKHMININDELKYQINALWKEYEFNKEKLTKYVNN